MSDPATAPSASITLELLNGDLAREYQAIIAYVNYSQVLDSAAYMKRSGTGGTPTTSWNMH